MSLQACGFPSKGLNKRQNRLNLKNVCACKVLSQTHGRTLLARGLPGCLYRACILFSFCAAWWAPATISGSSVFNLLPQNRLSASNTFVEVGVKTSDPTFLGPISTLRSSNLVSTLNLQFTSSERGYFSKQICSL